jgi:hypothetical protein
VRDRRLAMAEEKEKWTIQRIHKEVSEARTKMFVVTKVLETGDLGTQNFPEWVLVIRPLLKDLIQNTQRVSELLETDKQPQTKD